MIVPNSTIQTPRGHLTHAKLRNELPTLRNGQMAEPHGSHALSIDVISLRASGATSESITDDGELTDMISVRLILRYINDKLLTSDATS